MTETKTCEYHKCRKEYSQRPGQTKWNFLRTLYCSFSCSNAASREKQLEKERARAAEKEKLKLSKRWARIIFFHLLRPTNRAQP